MRSVDEAVSSSVLGRRWGQGRDHLIDPRTGLAAEALADAATVIAPDAATAEALTKVVLMAGLDDAESHVSRAGAMALATAAGGAIRCSANWPSG